MTVDDDAVRQAAQWLAERGVVVPPGEGPDGARTRRGQGRAERRGDSAARRVEPTNVVPPDPEPLPPDGSEVDLSHPRAVGADPSDPDADPEALARTIILRKLAAQARTRTELSRALQAKNVPLVAAEAVLDRMEEVGLVDDPAFARDWVASRQQRRHLSRSALRRELTAKGVDREEIDSALETVDGDDELQAARSLAAKKARSLEGLDREVQYRRLAGVLGRRGFSGHVVGQVVAEALDQTRR